MVDTVKQASEGAFSILKKDQTTWALLNDVDKINKQQDLLYKQHQQELEGELSIWDRLIASENKQ